MVLRILLVTTILFSSSVFAQKLKAKHVPYVRKAQAFYAKKKYVKSLKTLRRAYNFRKPKTIPTKPLYLIAANLQKLKRHQDSIYYFGQLIRKQYKRQHIKVLRGLKAGTVDEVEIPKTLLSIYYFMGQSHYYLYTKKALSRDAQRATRYFTICDEHDYGKKADEFIENLAAKEDYKAKQRNYFEFFVNAGQLYYQDQVSLTLTDTGEKISILNNNKAICYGAGLRYSNAFKGYEVSGCAFSGTATVKNQGGSKNYSQNGVPVAGALVEAGYFIKPYSEQTRFGLSLPIMYRSGAFQEPKGSTIEGSQNFSYGLMLTGGWQLPIVEMQLKMANMQQTNLFLIQGVYNF